MSFTSNVRFSVGNSVDATNIQKIIDNGEDLVTRSAFIGSHASNGTGTVTSSAAKISFNVEEYDTDGWYDSGSKTRFTVPSSLDLKYVMIQVWVSFGSTPDQPSIITLKNNAQYKGMAKTGIDLALQQTFRSFAEVSDGDYFELQMNVASGSISVVCEWSIRGFR